MGDHLETAGAIFILNLFLSSLFLMKMVWVKATDIPHTHRTEADYDAWTGLLHVEAIKALSSYFSTSMALVCGTSFIGHLPWYIGLILHTAGSHVVR